MKKKLLKGFTLVELIVVMILMGIITTAIVMVMRPAQNMYTNITNKAYEEQTTLVVSKMINQELRYAAGISVACTRVDKNTDGTDNKSTYPSVGAIGNYKHYIKLSNDYRDANLSNYNMYLKGARGSFEKGTIDSGVITKSVSSINDKTFDDYDFQFSIEGYNNKPGEESLSIGFVSNFLRASKDNDAIQAAQDIGKPDPEFIPMYEKAYHYSETFEFINLKKSNVIGKKTSGLTLTDEYKYGTPVDHLGDTGNPYYDPRETGCDNTIWIFYNLPEEAEDKDTIDPSTSTTPVSTTVSTVTLNSETSPVTSASVSSVSAETSAGSETSASSETEPPVSSDTPPVSSSETSAAATGGSGGSSGLPDATGLPSGVTGHDDYHQVGAANIGGSSYTSLQGQYRLQNGSDGAVEGNIIVKLTIDKDASSFNFAPSGGENTFDQIVVDGNDIYLICDNSKINKDDGLAIKFNIVSDQAMSDYNSAAGAATITGVELVNSIG